MLRFVIITVVVMAILVALRIVRLSLNVKTKANVVRKDGSAQVIEMPSREVTTLTIQEFSFANFPESDSPKDLEDFFERMFVKVARVGSHNDVQMYTLHVTTPKGLKRAVESDTYRFGRDLLIVDRFERTLIRAALEKHIYELPQLARQID
jgi:hypothetical protein